MSGFLKAQNLNEALEALSAEGAEVLAGGTDFMLELRKARLTGGKLPETIVDISAVPEMTRLEINDGSAYVGAAVSFRTLETSPEVLAAMPVLAQASASVGSVQVRQTGTIGGNAANASPAADGVTALTALDAVAVIGSKNGERRLAMKDLILSPGKNALDSTEMIIGFEFENLPPAAGQKFAKVGRRSAVSIARLNLGVCLNAAFDDVRLSLGACFPSPRRLTKVEAFLKDSPHEYEAFREAGRLCATEFTDVCGVRSSATYKLPAIERVVAATLLSAWQAVGGAA